MESKLYRKKSRLTKLEEAKLVDRLSEEIRFDKKELRRLIAIYKKYLKGTWYMDLPVFSEFLHNSFGLAEEFFMNRIFRATDTNKDGRVDVEEFIRVVAIMLRGSREEKIQLCFDCYDISENDELTRDDITALLVEALTESPYKEVNPDVVRDLADLMMLKMDEDRDGIITHEEFKKVCLNNWVFTEAFGQCMPDHRYRAAFLIVLETDQDDVESPTDDAEKGEGN